MNDDKRWLPRLGATPGAAIRLFCIPYAGGGASVYYPWREALPAGLELCPVQLPGRESRTDEESIDDFGALLDALAPVVGRHLDLPYAIYGHSMGAGLAFELARRLSTSHGRAPEHLFVGAHRSPNKPYSYPSVRSVSDDKVLQILARFNGMPRMVLENQDLLDMFLPILRSDLSVCETYAYRQHIVLDCPITLFTGMRDANVGPAQIAGWSEQTTGPFSHHEIDADHFFLKSHKEEVLGTLVGALAGRIGAPSALQGCA